MTTRTLVLFSLLLLAGCKHKPQQDPVNKLPEMEHYVDSFINAMKSDTTAPADTLVPYTTRLVAWYVMGEKYRPAPDSAGMKQWIEKSVSWFDHHDKPYNLFSHSGGGPNGSEWNADNDLFIVALFSERTEPPKLSVLLNGVTFTKAELHFHASPSGKGMLAWFILPQEEWAKRLRKTKAAEEKLIWPDSADYVFRPDPAQTIEVKVIANDTKPATELRGFFRVAYGE